MAYYNNYTQPNYGGINYGNYQPNYMQPPMQTQQPMQQTQPVQAVPQNVNKIYVTSLEDALGRFANVNTITVYHLQDESSEIEVATDGFGKKSYKIRKLSEYTPTEPKKEQQINSVTHEQLSKLQEQVKSLEERLKSVENQVVKNEYLTKKAEAADNE